MPFPAANDCLLQSDGPGCDGNFAKGSQESVAPVPDDTGQTVTAGRRAPLVGGLVAVGGAMSQSSAGHGSLEGFLGGLAFIHATAALIKIWPLAHVPARDMGWFQQDQGLARSQ